VNLEDREFELQRFALKCKRLRVVVSWYPSASMWATGKWNIGGIEDRGSEIP
jgi:hypothetical protein